MAAAFIKSIANGSTTSPVVITNDASAITVGTLAIVAVTIRGTVNPTAIAVTDSNGGNTWQQDGAAQVDVTNSFIRWYFSTSIAGAIAATTGTVTVTTTGGTFTRIEATLVTASGCKTSGWFDVHHSAGPTTSNAPNSGNATTTANGDFAIGVIPYVAASGAGTQGAGWTKAQDVGIGGSTTNSVFVEYQVLGNAGAYAATASLSSSVGWDADIWTYLAAPTTPVNTVAPVVSGTTTVGQTLSTTDGTWTNTPTSFAYRWQRDNHGGGSYSNIGSATANTYVLVDGDDGCNIRCVVTATNGSGSGPPANSNAVGTVVEPAPVNTVAPLVSGSAPVGSILSVTTGTWSNMGGYLPAFTYQWTRAGVNIGGATASSYTTVSADATHAVGCTVTATNTGGNASQASSNTITPTSSSGAVTVPAEGEWGLEWQP